MGLPAGGLRELSLFAGAGGGLLAGKLLGWRLACAVEIEPYCQRVLRQRMRDGLLDDAPIWDDIRTFDGKPWRGRIDVVSGGVPCQAWSVAGRQQGEQDPRNLWPDTLRIIREVCPRYCLLENSSNIVNFPYFGRILGELAEMGFDAAWGVLPASAVGANHYRPRIWIACERVADAEDQGLAP
jgi:DNA (cytosine-5)-methyltransferase 1